MNRIPGLPRREGGYIVISTPEELAQVLSCPIHDLSSESVDFTHASWVGETEDQRAAANQFLTSVQERVCADGRLRHPKTPLPPFGARAEAALVGGKPGPACKYGVGAVTTHGWDSVFLCWRVGITFDEPAGTYYGQPILGTSTFPRLVHVIGEPDRPFSTMTPGEIGDFYLAVRESLADS
jgi:hypothetical protein